MSPGDSETNHGAEGRFDAEARDHGAQLWASQHHRLLAAGGAALLGAAPGAARARRPR
ncbi:hypothetical protein ACFWP2_14695 [Kitasatospora sp. NPDC058444]|uniref:hypothetical protein n=1 Tax=Kitasatospora sp. NPDC058444 TaxID=3346504 RepID=UPI00365088DC